MLAQCSLCDGKGEKRDRLKVVQTTLGLFVQTLKNGVSKEQLDASVVNKEYPRPTLEQLN